MNLSLSPGGKTRAQISLNGESDGFGDGKPGFAINSPMIINPNSPNPFMTTGFKEIASVCAQPKGFNDPIYQQPTKNNQQTGPYSSPSEKGKVNKGISVQKGPYPVTSSSMISSSSSSSSNSSNYNSSNHTKDYTPKENKSGKTNNKVNKIDTDYVEDKPKKYNKPSIKELDPAEIEKITQSVAQPQTLQALLNMYPAEVITNDKGKKEKPVYTHTSMGLPAGSYDVPQEEMGTLYRLLDKALAKGEQVHLTEKATDPSPLKVDLDFRFDLEDSIKRQYTMDHIKGMVKVYNDIIAEYVDIDVNEIKACVFERKEPYKFKGNIKDGIHLIYPEVMIDTTLQQVIRDVALTKCAEVLSDLPLKNAYTDVIDLAVIAKNNWLMYGCCKPGLKPYLLTHVFDFYMKEEKDLSAYTNGFLIQYLSKWAIV